MPGAGDLLIVNPRPASITSMSKELLATLAAIIGGIVTGIFTWLSSRASSSSTERNQFRADILSRLKEVEARTKHLEEEVTIWKIRYWSLYARTLQMYDITPPEFHTMDLAQLEQGYRAAVEKLNRNKSKSNDS